MRSKYLTIVEQSVTGFSACSPDLPGYIATGATRREVEREMRDAMQFHIGGMREELEHYHPQTEPPAGGDGGSRHEASGQLEPKVA